MINCSSNSASYSGTQPLSTLHEILSKINAGTIVHLLGVEGILLEIPVALLTLGLGPKLTELVLLAREVTRHPDRSLGDVTVVTFENGHGEEAVKVIRVAALEGTNVRLGLTDVAAVVLPAVDGVAERGQLVHAPGIPGEVDVRVATKGLADLLGVPGEDVEAAALFGFPSVVGVDALGLRKVIADNDVEAAPVPGHLP